MKKTRTMKEAIETARRPAMARRSVYAPLEILEKFDRMARKEKVSANRLMVVAIERMLGDAG